MQYQFGYPTPPASPSPFELPKCAQQQQQQQQAAPIQPRYVQPAPEQRLGRFLAGTLQLTGILGTGAYGVVYSAIDIKTHVRYAVKTLSKYNADGTPLDRRQVAFQTREIRLHWLASAHPNVVSMLKIIDDPDCTYVILEYCPEGDLFYNITECGQYVGKDALAKQVFLQILEAVEHCHSQGIYHRDLKPENILVSNQGETVKLADFGLATSSDRSEDYGCGSTFYMSPECLDHTTRRPYYYCAPNDVWSLGVILVNLTCGRNPWKQASFEDSTYRAFTRSKGFLKTILPISDELNEILAAIFTRNPDERITLPELKARIIACHKFTEQPQQPSSAPATCASPVSPPASPESYVSAYEDAIIDEDDDDFEYDDAPLSPASSDDSISDGSSDDGSSMTSSCSSLEELDEDDDLCPEPRGAVTPPPQAEISAAIYDPEAPQHQVLGFPSEYLHQTPFHHQFPQEQPVPVQPHMNMSFQMPPQQQIFAPKVAAPQPPAPYLHQHQLPYILDVMYKFAHPGQHQVPQPVLHHPHPVPFHQHPHHAQVPMFACY